MASASVVISMYQNYKIGRIPQSEIKKTLFLVYVVLQGSAWANRCMLCYEDPLVLCYMDPFMLCYENHFCR
jgi:hypothetical protein